MKINTYMQSSRQSSCLRYISLRDHRWEQSADLGKHHSGLHDTAGHWGKDGDHCQYVTTGSTRNFLTPLKNSPKVSVRSLAPDNIVARYPGVMSPHPASFQQPSASMWMSPIDNGSLSHLHICYPDICPTLEIDGAFAAFSTLLVIQTFARNPVHAQAMVHYTLNVLNK
ncbi:hypothetical protein PM082_012381 [Marasmius tenuissimus]|nr:hypothetical protein PM082_012381 [Marasmius tenuissimus]